MLGKGGPSGEEIDRRTEENSMLELLALSGTAATLLWIIAAVLVIAGHRLDRPRRPWPPAS